MSRTELDVAWAAGLFEGEGYFEIPKTTKSSCRAGISSTDLDVLQRFHRIVRVGTIHLHKKANYRSSVKPAWMWRTSNREECLTIIFLFAPFMGQRRRKRADECLSTLTRPIPERMCDHCGKPFVPARAMQGHQRFCSYRCRRQAEYVRLGGRKVEGLAERRHSRS